MDDGFGTKYDSATETQRRRQSCLLTLCLCASGATYYSRYNKYFGRFSSRSKARQTSPAANARKNSSRIRKLSAFAAAGSDFRSDAKSFEISITSSGLPTEISRRADKSRTRGELSSHEANKRSLSIPGKPPACS